MMKANEDHHNTGVGHITNGVNSVQLQENTEQHIDLSDFADLPNALIVTNLDEEIFEQQDFKERFEALFYDIDTAAEFQYLKSFRRARVVLQDGISATKCRIRLDETKILNNKIRCYFAQPPVMKSGNTSPHLHPPLPEKQFLISPPASPPVGWEPVTENEPVINYDLLAAVASLKPGEVHELHPQTESHPSIVVHVCEDPAGYSDRPAKIVQTRRPDVT